MKLQFFSKIFFVLLFSFSLNANENIDTKVKKLTLELRCMTCQNQAVYSSDTDFSLNIKSIIKKKLENNETEKEIIDFLIYRYGEYIVFEPQISKQNIFLWAFPFLILAISLVFLLFRIKRNQ